MNILSFVQGAKFAVLFRLKGRNITGYSARLQVRPTEKGPLYAEAFTSTLTAFEPSNETSAKGSITVSYDGVDSELLVEFTGNETLKFDKDRGVYDLFIFSPSNNPERVYGGSVSNIRKVTQW